jgi:hypothetical protein
MRYSNRKPPSLITNGKLACCVQRTPTWLAILLHLALFVMAAETSSSCSSQFSMAKYQVLGGVQWNQFCKKHRLLPHQGVGPCWHDRIQLRDKGLTL